MYYIPTACVSLQIRGNLAIKVSRMYSSDVNIGRTGGELDAFKEKQDNGGDWCPQPSVGRRAGLDPKLGENLVDNEN